MKGAKKTGRIWIETFLRVLRFFVVCINLSYSNSGFLLFGHLPALLLDERRAGDQVAA